jgi:hypothetical protein
MSHSGKAAQAWSDLSGQLRQAASAVSGSESTQCALFILPDQRDIPRNHREVVCPTVCLCGVVANPSAFSPERICVVSEPERSIVTRLAQGSHWFGWRDPQPLGTENDCANTRQEPFASSPIRSNRRGRIKIAQ